MMTRKAEAFSLPGIMRLGLDSLLATNHHVVVDGVHERLSVIPREPILK